VVLAFLWRAAALPVSPALTLFPAMMGWDSKELPAWKMIMESPTRKVRCNALKLRALLPCSAS
jgi:hypothetical protein